MTLISVQYYVFLMGSMLMSFNFISLTYIFLQIRSTFKSASREVLFSPLLFTDTSKPAAFFFVIHLIILFYFLLFIYIRVYLTDNVVIVSGVQQSDSVIHVSILFQIIFPFRLLHNIEQSSLCYTIGPCWLSILNISVCTCPFQIP